jgi:F-type H+-transporting ATPase subunit epsilon
MDKLFEVELVTPHGVEYEGKVLSVTCPGSEGLFQVLYNHAPFLSSLAIGLLTLQFDGGEKSVYTISGGVVQVFHNHVRILADSAERTDRIDAARALQARERAVMRLKTKDENIDTERARIALMRAINRLKAAGNL